MITTPQRLLIRTEEDTMKNDKKYFDEPEMKIVLFTVDDVITTSGDDPLEVAELEEIPD